ncbi:MAG TPA: hypothetical protein VGL80_20805 [Pseudonocardiaceae bacterium]
MRGRPPPGERLLAGARKLTTAHAPPAAVSAAIGARPATARDAAARSQVTLG